MSLNLARAALIAIGLMLEVIGCLQIFMQFGYILSLDEEIAAKALSMVREGAASTVEVSFSTTYVGVLLVGIGALLQVAALFPRETTKDVTTE